MAIPVARVHLAVANAALPGLLPTPPKSTMISSPLHRPAACIPILPAKSASNTITCRADAVERLDAHKTKRPGSSSPPSSSSRSSQQRSPASSSPGRASSCDRWDSNKNKWPSSVASRAPSSGERWDSNKRPVSRSSTQAERWDVHKKPHSLQQGAHGGGGGMGSEDKETMVKLPQATYAGPGFLNSPEPCVLPIPAFMVRAR